MKTRLLFFLLLIIVSTSNGQTIFLRFGPSFSILTWKSSANESKPIPKFNIGLDAMAGVNYLNFKYFNLSSAIGYIQKGGSETITKDNYEFFTTKTTQFTSRLNFFTLNTTFNFKIPIKGFVEPNIFAGPRIDYLFSYNKDAIFNQLSYYKLNKVIYGILCGGGINFNIKRFQLGLVLDYYLNINKLVDCHMISSIGYDSGTIKIYDNTFTLNALIGFKF
jgi:hypothetical protein